MEEGYYRSQALELEGVQVIPGTRDILDAQVVPLALARARLAGIPTPEHYISNGYFDPPVVVDPINPFMSGHSVVLGTGRREQVARSLTRNYTYAICCQELPGGARISTFRMVLGRTTNPRYRELGRQVWEAFRIPAARVRVIRSPGAPDRFSAIEVLAPASLSRREHAVLEQGLEWRA